MQLGSRSVAAGGGHRSFLAILAVLALVGLLGVLVPPPGAVAVGDAADSGTERVSVSTGGVPGNGVSHGVDMSGDGRYVVFGSSSTNLVPGGTSVFDVYLRDRSAGTTELISRSDAGQSGSSTSGWPSVSRDGTRVAFASIANNLVTGDTNGTADVFVRDRTSGRTILVSANLDGRPGNGRSERSEISADGRFVVFQSAATDLVDPAPTGGTVQIYVRDLDTGTTELVSRSATGEASSTGAGDPAVSRDGRYVAFVTAPTAANLDPDNYPGAYGRIFVRDRIANVTRVIPTFINASVGEPAISGDGRYVSYAAQGGRRVVDRTTGVQTGVEFGGRTNGTARFSDDGSTLAYYSQITDGTYRLYLHDVGRGGSVEVSLTDEGAPVASGAEAPMTFGPPAISDDGRIAGFWSAADGVVPGDTGAIRDVYVRDRGDLLGPAIRDLATIPDGEVVSLPLTLTAVVDDTERGGAVIAGAEVAVDGGAWQPMAATDGAFDTPVEAVSFTFVNLAAGDRRLCVRGTDGRGNVTEPPGCLTVTVGAAGSPLAFTLTTLETDETAVPDGASLYARVEVLGLEGSVPVEVITNLDSWDLDTRDEQLLPVGEASVEPFVTYGERVTSSIGRALVRVDAGVVLADGTPVPFDLNSSPLVHLLLLEVDLNTGEWATSDGTLATPQSCVVTPGTPQDGTIAGSLCFAVSPLSLDNDLDGDGLLDAWERFGLSMDASPVVDLPLHEWGATPFHKDLFVEYDIVGPEPTFYIDQIFRLSVQQGLRAVQDAFAVAPVDAGGVDNPDGLPGINLWIDSPAAYSELRLAGSDGGERIHQVGPCGVSDELFYDIKAEHFDPARRWVFRYAIKSDTLNCGRGGQGELNGNDFIVLNSDETYSTFSAADRTVFVWPGGETFMHELGHNLGLRHGGFEHANNKPNYASIMNYNYAFTLRRDDGTTGFLDFSPARTADGRRPADLLPDVDESAPPQGIVLGPDRDHDLFYPDLECAAVGIPASSAFDLLPSRPGEVVGPTLHLGLNARLKDLPTPCENAQAAAADTAEVHVDHDDWAAITLSFREFGDAADGPLNVADDDDYPTDDEIAALREQMVTTDVEVTVDDPAPTATIGTPLTVRATARNLGGVTAAGGALEVTVVSATSAASIDQFEVSGPPECDAGPPLVCPFSTLTAGDEETIELTVLATLPGTAELHIALVDVGAIDPDETNDLATLTITAVDGGGGAGGGSGGGDAGDGGGGAGDEDIPTATFVPLTPSRSLDTRGDAKVGNAAGTGTPYVLKVTGAGGVPTSGVAAVALNVTATQSQNPTIGGGYITVYPCDKPRPDTSNLNFITDQTIANSVIAPVSATGEVCFYVYGTTHLLADVSGYFPTEPGFNALTPSRIMNTRDDAKVGNAAGTGTPYVLKVTGAGGVPTSGVAAVALNVTATQSENPTIGGGYVTVYPCDKPRPDASNLNFITDQTVPNSVIAPVSANGEVCFYVYGTTHLLADVSGYIESGAGFNALTPSRIMNTRGDAKVGNAAGTGAPYVLKVAGVGGVPATGARAVVLNVTATQSQNPTIGGGYITVYPCDKPRPDASNLNFITDQTVPNSVIAPVSATGEVCFYVYGTTHLLADVSGYFAN